VFKGNDFGVHVKESDVDIKGNVFEESRVVFHYSYIDMIDNSISNSLVASFYSDLDISGNTIFGKGMKLFGSVGVVSGNVISSCASSGIEISNSPVYLENNVVCNSQTDIYTDIPLTMSNNTCDSYFYTQPVKPCSSDCSSLTLCEDTDFASSSILFNTKGSIYFNGYKASDYCIDSKTLKEHYCTVEGFDSHILKVGDIKKNSGPFEYLCYDGEIRQMDHYCYDSDDFEEAFVFPLIPGDENYHVKGTVYINDSKYADECVSSSTLKEYYCANDDVDYKLHNCNCLEGACSDVGLMFSSSRTWRGELGGIQGADLKCEEIAERADLGGDWKAVISDSYVSVKERFGKWFAQNQVFTRMHGGVVADGIADLFDGEIGNAILYNEDGEKVSRNTGTGSPNNPWTGSSALGGAAVSCGSG
jgi:hypothetical protein